MPPPTPLTCPPPPPHRITSPSPQPTCLPINHHLALEEIVSPDTAVRSVMSSIGVRISFHVKGSELRAKKSPLTLEDGRGLGRRVRRPLEPPCSSPTPPPEQPAFGALPQASDWHLGRFEVISTSFHLSPIFKCVCVCVCERKRDRERGKVKERLCMPVRLRARPSFLTKVAAPLLPVPPLPALSSFIFLKQA